VCDVKCCIFLYGSVFSNVPNGSECERVPARGHSKVEEDVQWSEDEAEAGGEIR
jgi:hypothetical protein